jgi:hypothetical protein
MIDRLREWLLPTLGLMILAALWSVAKVRAVEEDLNHSTASAATPHTMLDRVAHADD